MAEMLVKILNGVFDPPPAALAVPWLYLLAVAALSVIGVAVAVVIGIRLGRRGTIEELRST
jgi:putative ABC transport system permease protein